MLYVNDEISQKLNGSIVKAWNEKEWEEQKKRKLSKSSQKVS